LFAIVYLIFDVETVFVFPWGVVMKEIGLRAFVEIVIFFVILGLGLLYAWKKDALKWV
jgi:NADH-quinone oxidoreductase subunit A